ncbi:MAG: queuosine precursor transporter [Alphaproteobacteria bacterium]|nr:queuosine precursor transporter [Alphaproteobacteria bacterium]
MSQQPSDLLGSPRINRRDFVLFFTVGLFMVSLVVAAVTAVKIQSIDIFGFVLLVPAGSLAFGLTYLATDVISEVWGRASALMVLLAGLALRFVMLLLFLYAMYGEYVFGFIGVAESWSPERQDAFLSILGSSNRINIAGMIAFAISALTDIYIFDRLRRLQAGKNRLWLRNNISTMVSQILNSTVFVIAAFGWTMGWGAIGSLILGQIVIKLAVAAIDTPLIYFLRNLALGRKLFDFRG